MDEMRLEEWFNPFYRWGLKGQTPLCSFHQARDNQQSFFGGLSLSTKKEFVHLADHQNTKELINFLEIVKRERREEITQRLPKHLEKLQDLNLKRIRSQKGDKKEEIYEGLILIFLDGAGFHRSRELKAYLKENYGIFELLRFPTYSPDLNPQEHVWKALRKHLSGVWGQYSFSQMVDRACFFLRTGKFNYTFL